MVDGGPMTAKKYRPLHPFPARMGPDVVEEALPARAIPLRVLDPMMGSGTTLVWSRIKGHQAFGIDRDPLAVTIARSSTADFDVDTFRLEAAKVLTQARKIASAIPQSEAYPIGADEETKQYVRYWFDIRARKQLAALALTLQRGRFETDDFIKLAISRMIVTKSYGVSLALDVSHSRPHRHKEWLIAPTFPFEAFPKQVDAISKRAIFGVSANTYAVPPIVSLGDCRSLSYEDGFFDLVITSPPYLNAIDYLRGHKLSLVWLGYSAAEIREIRSSNVGTDIGSKSDAWDDIVSEMVASPVDLPKGLLGKIRRYASDLDSMMREMVRVTRAGGTILLVIGDCTVRGFDILNSRGVIKAAQRHNANLVRERSRPLHNAKRYLPPPSVTTKEGQITKRMRNEVILEFRT